jgi:hypothetical protein
MREDFANDIKTVSFAFLEFPLAVDHRNRLTCGYLS